MDARTGSHASSQTTSAHARARTLAHIRERLDAFASSLLHHVRLSFASSMPPQDMGVDTADDPYKHAFDPASTTLGAYPGMPAAQRGSEDPLPSGCMSGSRIAADATIAMLPAGGWANGPLGGGRGRLAPVSDRPLLCMSVHGDLAVVGSADHGLIEVSCAPSVDGGLTKKRTLYTKQYGHTEWVASVSHCPDGRVISAGLDSKVCLWNANGQPKCVDLTGHTGSVSKVLASADNNLAISAGYDKTLRLWSIGTRPREVQCLRCHRAPVMHLSWAAGVLASADRDGSVVSWDPRTGDATHLGAHGGHATALAAASYASPDEGAAGSSDAAGAGLMPRGLLSGGQDGVVRLWDLRTRASAMETRVHEGAVNDIIAHRMPDGSPMVITCGADRRVLALDPRMSLQAVQVFQDHRDFVYSLTAIGHIAVSGGGDGSVLCHDLHEGRLTCEMRAGSNAVRAMHADPGRLVCAGDDGAVMAFEFTEGGGTKAKVGGAAGASAAARREARLGPLNGNFGGAAAANTAGGGASDRSATSDKPLSAAQQYAEKKRLAMEKAERLKAERKAKQQAEMANRPEWDDGGVLPQVQGAIPRNAFGTPLYPPGHPMGPPDRSGGGGGGAQSAAQSELDMLHAMGDKKFGRRR